QVADEMRPTALPGGSPQHGGDGVLQPRMRIGDHQLDALEPAGTQAPHKREPAGAVLCRHHLEPEHLAAAFAVDAYRDQAGHVHDASFLAALHLERVEPDVAVRPRQLSLTEALHYPIEFLGHLRDLALRHLLDAER